MRYCFAHELVIADCVGYTCLITGAFGGPIRLGFGRMTFTLKNNVKINDHTMPSVYLTLYLVGNVQRIRHCLRERVNLVMECFFNQYRNSFNMQSQATWKALVSEIGDIVIQWVVTTRKLRRPPNCAFICFTFLL
ncbi:hypothetical protein ACFE04_007131 [Oxalis oulophora]